MSARKMDRRGRQLLRARIASERGVPVEDITIERITFFTRTYALTPTHIGEVQVSYEPVTQWQAIYGFDALYQVFIYAD